MSFRNKTGESLKNLLEAKGEDGAAIVIERALEKKKIRPEDFSLREIWEACTGGKNIMEAVASSSFPKITGTLINSKIISGYESVPKIGDDLVTTVSSNMQVDTIAGFSDVETPEEVGEGDAYKDSTISEKYVQAQNVKYGRMISITKEMIFFDKTGQVMNKANRIGIKAAQYKERLILRGVQDLDTKVYRPSGVPTAFYSSTNRNLISTNPFGESGLTAVRVRADSMKDDSLGVGDDDYIFVNVDNLIALVPRDLEVQAWELANSTLTPEGSEGAANFYKGRFKVRSSPFVGAQSTTTWFYGDFKEDFWWEEVWPLTVESQKPGHEDDFIKDIKARVRVYFYGSCVAIDTKHCFKNTAT